MAVYEQASGDETPRNITAMTVGVAGDLHTMKIGNLPSPYGFLHKPWNKRDSDTKHILGTCATARSSVLAAWRKRLREEPPTSGKG